MTCHCSCESELLNTSRCIVLIIILLGLSGNYTCTMYPCSACANYKYLCHRVQKGAMKLKVHHNVNKGLLHYCIHNLDRSLFRVSKGRGASGK